MPNKLEDIFCPSPERELKQLEFILQLHMEQIGHCSTCLHHVPTEAPGWITDYGECLKSEAFFPVKVCSSESIDCPQYTENTDSKDALRDKIKDLRKIIEDRKKDRNDSNY